MGYDRIIGVPRQTPRAKPQRFLTPTTPAPVVTYTPPNRRQFIPEIELDRPLQRAFVTPPFPFVPPSKKQTFLDDVTEVSITKQRTVIPSPPAVVITYTPPNRQVTVQTVTEEQSSKIQRLTPTVSVVSYLPPSRRIVFEEQIVDIPRLRAWVAGIYSPGPSFIAVPFVQIVDEGWAQSVIASEGWSLSQIVNENWIV